MFGVSPATVARVKKIAEESPAVGEAIAAGKVSISEGAFIADQPALAQAQILRTLEDDDTQIPSGTQAS